MSSRVSSILKEVERLREKAERLAEAQKAAIPRDVKEFYTGTLGLKAYKYQLDLLDLLTKHQFVAVRWARQTGKSHTVSAYLLWRALTNPGWLILITAPSFRQSKINISKIASFARSLGPLTRALKTKVYCANGSQIIALPCNPDGIRGFSAHICFIDEFSFIANDEDLMDAVLFALNATGGQLIVSSTPWSTDHLFWRIWNEPAYEDYAKSHVTFEQALEPNGPIKRAIIEKITKQLANDPWRYNRELLAEWAEDEGAYFSQALITSCIDPQLEPYDYKALGIPREVFRS